MINKNLKVKLGKWELDNPIIPASGTFGYGYEFAQFYDINILGSFSMKGTTCEPRFGNPLPRIAECDNSMINSIGLQNPGIDAVINSEFKKLKKVYRKKVVANIAGTTIEEYVTIAKKLDKLPIVGIIEVNISCPNVKKGAMKFVSNPKHLSLLVKALKKSTKKPVFIKLSATVTDIVEMAMAAKNAGADGLSLINTIFILLVPASVRLPSPCSKSTKAALYQLSSVRILVWSWPSYSKVISFGEIGR